MVLIPTVVQASIVSQVRVQPSEQAITRLMETIPELFVGMEVPRILAMLEPPACLIVSVLQAIKARAARHRVRCVLLVNIRQAVEMVLVALVVMVVAHTLLRPRLVQPSVTVSVLPAMVARDLRRRVLLVL